MALLLRTGLHLTRAPADELEGQRASAEQGSIRAVARGDVRFESVGSNIALRAPQGEVLLGAGSNLRVVRVSAGAVEVATALDVVGGVVRVGGRAEHFALEATPPGLLLSRAWAPPGQPARVRRVVHFGGGGGPGLPLPTSPNPYYVPPA